MRKIKRATIFSNQQSNHFPPTARLDFQNKKVSRTVQEVPQAEAAANPRHQEKEKKMTQINVCIANKQMRGKHKDQLPFPQARWSKC